MPLFRKNPNPPRASAPVPAAPRPPTAPTAPTAPAAAAAAASPPPPVDDLFGIPEAHRFKRVLAEGRWQEFHDFLDTVTDLEERAFYLTRLSSIDERPEWLDEWVQARPGSMLPLLFRGSHGIHWAWEARGSGRAKTVKEDAWPVFHARLVDADRDLTRAAALDSRDPSPYERGIWVAMGLSLGQQEIRRRFAEAERRQHLDIPSVNSMVQALARKWSGSHEEMFEFARWASAQAPDGHRAHKAVALAHIEYWLDQPKESRAGYFPGEAVSAEIRQAADRSIRSSSYVVGKFAPPDRSVFAMCFYLMRDYRAQLEQMELIGANITSNPWYYLGNVGRSYERAWNEALRAVGPPAGPAAPLGRPAL